jgi:hypothetical protein
MRRVRRRWPERAPFPVGQATSSGLLAQATAHALPHGIAQRAHLEQEAGLLRPLFRAFFVFDWKDLFRPVPSIGLMTSSRSSRDVASTGTETVSSARAGGPAMASPRIVTAPESRRRRAEPFRAGSLVIVCPRTMRRRDRGDGQKDSPLGVRCPA